MNIDNCLITDIKHCELSKIILRVLNCNAFWLMHVDNGLFRILATDISILEYYWDKKYYLQDPNIPSAEYPAQVSPDPSRWKAHLGSDCEMFKKSGFLYDLYKLFDIEEFVSIEKSIGRESYCFRFFTKNNRFVFMNKLLNNMPFIKFFMDDMIGQLKIGLRLQSGVPICRPG